MKNFKYPEKNVWISGRVYFFLNDIYLVFHIFICLYLRGYLLDAVDNCGVILLSEELGDIRERHTDDISAKIHDDLSRQHKFGVFLLGSDILRIDAEMLSHHVYDKRRGHLLGLVRIDHVFQGFLRVGQIDIYLI